MNAFASADEPSELSRPRFWRSAYWPGVALLLLITSCGWIWIERWSGQLVTGCPLNAVALTLLLQARRHRWPGLLVMFVAAALFMVFETGKPLPVSLAIAAVDGIQIGACAVVLRRLLGPSIDLGKYRDLWIFSAVAAIGLPLVSIGLLTLAQPQHRPLVETLPHLARWAVGAALGYTLVTPAAIACAPSRLLAVLRNVGVRRFVVDMLTYTVAVVLIALRWHDQLGLLLVPALIWLTFRLGMTGAALGLTVQAFLVLAWALEAGHAANGAEAASHFAHLQVGLVLNALCAYPVAAALTNRWRLSKSLAASHASLEQAHDALRSSEQRYRLLAENSNDIILLTDAAGRLTYVSPAVTTVTGYRPDELLGEITHKLMHPADAQQAEARERAMSQEAEASDQGGFTYRVQHVDGRRVWLEARSTVLRDPASQEITGFLHIARDVTARKAMEAELERKCAEAEAANLAKSEFLANMSHEIRTPLNGVLGVTGALARTELQPAQREMVSLVENSGRALEALLGDILDLARIEAGKMEIRPAPFDLAASVNACAALFDAGAQAKGLDLEVEIAPDAQGAYVGDAQRLRQILSNLLGNAIKFTERGKVRLTVDAARGETSSELRFEVSDTGIGFDAATKARLFGRFEQADGSITRQFGGSGLGLSISQALAEAMGGLIEADAEQGRGAVFTLTLTLPRCASTPDLWVEDADPESVADPFAGLRVLYAEDHPTNRRVVELILGAAGVDLTCVENGAEAVEAFRHAAFDMILMDMQMPVMDGLSAVREIRRIEAETGAAPMPIHVLTANAMAEHVEASLAAGADSHLAKPIVPEVLLERVAETAEAARALRTARRSCGRDPAHPHLSEVA